MGTAWPLSRSWAAGSRDAVQLPALHVVDEPRHGDVLRDERVRPDSLDLRADVFLQVAERVEADLRGVRAVLLRQGVLEVLVLERQHAAVRLADHEELLRSEELVRNDERTESVLRRDPSCVPDHMSVSLPEPRERMDVDSGIHARKDREFLRGRQRESATVEGACIFGVPDEQLFQQGRLGHGPPDITTLYQGASFLHSEQNAYTTKLSEFA